MTRRSQLSTVSEVQLAAASMLLAQYSASISGVVGEVLTTSSSADVQVLTHLAANPEQRPHELMAVTGLSRPGAAAVVARLEGLGLVRRAFGRHDRRTTLTSLAPVGRRRMSELERALDGVFIESGPLATEIVMLLGDDRRPPSTLAAADTALVLHSRLATAVATYESQVDDKLQSIPRRQQVAIGTLMSWGLARPTQLAEVLQLSSGGLTYVMDQLESEGIITRTYGSDDDRRAVQIQLSDSGREHGRVMCSVLAANAAEISAALALTLAPYEP